MTPLAKMKCSPGGQAKSLTDEERATYQAMYPNWEPVGNEIRRTFLFKDYHETIAFVNATAWISHRDDHHPDMSVHYNKCVVTYTTHDAGGVTLNDYICAAKLDALFGL